MMSKEWLFPFLVSNGCVHVYDSEDFLVGENSVAFFFLEIHELEKIQKQQLFESDRFLLFV